MNAPDRTALSAAWLQWKLCDLAWANALSRDTAAECSHAADEALNRLLDLVRSAFPDWRGGPLISRLEAWLATPEDQQEAAA